jgi:hypothetical protein
LNDAVLRLALASAGRFLFAVTLENRLRSEQYLNCFNGLRKNPRKTWGWFRVLCVPMQVRFDIRRLGFIIL